MLKLLLLTVTGVEAGRTIVGGALGDVRIKPTADDCRVSTGSFAYAYEALRHNRLLPYVPREPCSRSSVFVGVYEIFATERMGVSDIVHVVKDPYSYTASHAERALFNSFNSFEIWCAANRRIRSQVGRHTLLRYEDSSANGDAGAMSANGDTGAIRILFDPPYVSSPRAHDADVPQNLRACFAEFGY